MKNGQFDVNIEGETVSVRRHFDIPATGSIDLDIRFKPSVPPDQLTVAHIHQASLNISIQFLQELLDKSKQAG